MKKIEESQSKEFEDRMLLEIYYSRVDYWKSLGTAPLDLEWILKQEFEDWELEEIKEIESRTEKYEDKTEEFKEDGKLYPRLVADEIMKNFSIVTFVKNEEIFIYKDGIYVPDGNAKIKEMCYKLVPDITNHQISEVINNIQGRTYIEMKSMNEDLNLIWVENGILNLDEMEMEYFDPKKYSTTKIPVKYDPDAVCTKFLKFLGEVLHKEDIPVIQEMFGYCLWKKYFIHKAFMFLGSGSNGKSTLLNALTAFLGSDNVSAVSLQDLNYNRFAPSRLYGKLANIYADIPATRLKYTGNFKMATGHDDLSYEKKHRDATKFMNFAKLCFSANTLPQNDDQSDAFFRRWTIIDFPNTFTDDNKDSSLLDKITTKEELSGILNWSLEGLERLRENGKFTDSKTQQDIKKIYIKRSDSLNSFILEKCERGTPDDYVTKDEFFSAYQDYCEDEDIELKGKALVGREVPVLAPFVRSGRRRVNGNLTRTWDNLLLIEKDVNSVHRKKLITDKNLSLYNDNIQLKNMNSVHNSDEDCDQDNENQPDDMFSNT